MANLSSTYGKIEINGAFHLAYKPMSIFVLLDLPSSTTVAMPSHQPVDGCQRIHAACRPATLRLRDCRPALATSQHPGSSSTKGMCEDALTSSPVAPDTWDGNAFSDTRIHVCDLDL